MTTTIRPTDARLLAADALRHLALDERAKAHIEQDQVLRPLFERMAARYIGGATLPECLERITAVNAQGHAATVDYMGENTRDAAKAHAETEEFLRLVQALQGRQFNSSVSLDLSHIGLIIEPEICHYNAGRIAAAAREIGTEMIVSMEWSARTDLILAAYERLCSEHSNVGITCQARLHRTPADLDRLLTLPGKIRLVKGAYQETADVAYPRGSDELRATFLGLACRLIASGHPCSIATHDPDLLDELETFITAGGWRAQPYEFEMLTGLGNLEGLRQRGHPTREYVVYGREWFLYLCNRLAEEPERLFTAVADALGARP
ncbi:proline dehydrogenase family protein [Deinococcus oregonensis]|uniref:Proline dehydrogenase family protein n=1 Tax=Deinococcus oregonensis TaxID=1805970 RepID=A0ABV6AYD5_9DEIO